MTNDMQNIADYWSDWTLDAVATSSQDRRLNEDAPEYDEVLAESLKANAYKAIMNALKQAALEHAKQPPAPAVPDELLNLLQTMVDLHERRGVVLTSHMNGVKDFLKAMLNAAPQPTGDDR